MSSKRKNNANNIKNQETKFIVLLDEQSIPQNILQKFDCGDEDLNDFLQKEAIIYEKSLLAKTYLLIHQNAENIIGFYSVLNDKVSIEETKSKTAFNQKIKSELTHYKNHLKDLPTVKIGRLGIDKNYQNKGYGELIIENIKYSFSNRTNKTGCHLIMVDSYKKSKKFYEKNGFSEYPIKPKNEDGKEDTETILMSFNLLKYIKERG